MSSNYHSNSGANNYMISGTWTNAFHTYAVDRENGTNTIYFDGKVIRSYGTDDGGAPEYLIFNQGGSGSTGSAAQVKVDWVRVWKK
jgi:beta-glucanase (GH16 family)